MMTKLLKKLSHAWNGNQKQSNSATTTTNVQEARGTYLHWKRATHSEEQREAFTQLCMRPDHVAVGISL